MKIGGQIGAYPPCTQYFKLSQLTSTRYFVSEMSTDSPDPQNQRFTTASKVLVTCSFYIPLKYILK